MSEEDQEFGSTWTEDKLDAVEDYLGAYIKVMEKQRGWVKLLYLDAFSGSGKITIKDGRFLIGSAVRAMKYSFDRFLLFDSNAKHIESLQARIMAEYPENSGKVSYASNDSNTILATIDSIDWKKKGWRGVAFLDPFATELNWNSLKHIAKTEIFDVWYLFPLMALNRMLVKTGDIRIPWQGKITELLGTDKWKDSIYSELPQQNIFGELELEKTSIDGLREYIISRFNTIFPTVSKKAVILRNKRNSPIFLLCFMGSNPSKPAQQISLRIADSLLDKIEKNQRGN